MRRQVTIGAGFALVLGGATATVVYAETATVAIVLPTHVVTAQVSLASPELSTKARHVELTDTVEARASETTLSTFATGYVIFRWFEPCTRDCGPVAIGYHVQTGTELVSSTGALYVTTSGAHWQSATSPPVRVRAAKPGPAGNTGANTILRTRLFPGYMLVANPKPITGGTSRVTHMISKSDFNQSADLLRDRLIDEVRATLGLTEPGMDYYPASLPTFDAVADHGVGEEVEVFHIRMTASVHAIGFAENRVRQLMRERLSRTLPAGHQLTSDPVHIAYEVDDVTQDGIFLHGTVIGYEFVIPQVNAIPNLTGMTIASAVADLAELFPDADIRVETSNGLPMMPVVAHHIVVKVEPKPLL